MKDSPTVSITHVINSDTHISLLTISYEWWYFINIVLSSHNIVGRGIKKPHVMYLVFWVMRAEGKKRLKGETSTLGRNRWYTRGLCWFSCTCILVVTTFAVRSIVSAASRVSVGHVLMVSGQRWASVDVHRIHQSTTGIFLLISSHRSLKTGRTKDDDDDDDDDGRHGYLFNS